MISNSKWARKTGQNSRIAQTAVQAGRAFFGRIVPAVEDFSNTAPVGRLLLRVRRSSKRESQDATTDLLHRKDRAGQRTLSRKGDDSNFEAQSISKTCLRNWASKL